MECIKTKRIFLWTALLECVATYSKILQTMLILPIIQYACHQKKNYLLKNIIYSLIFSSKNS